MPAKRSRYSWGVGRMRRVESELEVQWGIGVVLLDEVHRLRAEQGRRVTFFAERLLVAVPRRAAVGKDIWPISSHA